MIDKLVIINAPHPMIFEREMRENPVQRWGSNYTFSFNNYDGFKWDEALSANDFAGLTQGILGEQIKSGRYTDADVKAWKQAWSVPGALNAGLDYYRANHLKPAVQRDPSGRQGPDLMVGPRRLPPGPSRRSSSCRRW